MPPRAGPSHPQSQKGHTAAASVTMQGRAEGQGSHSEFPSRTVLIEVTAEEAIGHHSRAARPADTDTRTSAPNPASQNLVEVCSCRCIPSIDGD